MAKVLYQGHSYLSLLKCVHVYMCVYGGVSVVYIDKDVKLIQE